MHSAWMSIKFMHPWSGPNPATMDPLQLARAVTGNCCPIAANATKSVCGRFVGDLLDVNLTDRTG